MELKKIVLFNKYFDAYEKMLTDRQREVFEYYYHDDLSYQEIADILNISRAAVFDTLKRTTESLSEIENKLGIVSKYDKLINELKLLNIDEVDEILRDFTRGGNYE